MFLAKDPTLRISNVSTVRFERLPFASSKSDRCRAREVAPTQDLQRALPETKPKWREAGNNEILFVHRKAAIPLLFSLLLLVGMPEEDRIKTLDVELRNHRIRVASRRVLSDTHKMSSPPAACVGSAPLPMSLKKQIAISPTNACCFAYSRRHCGERKFIPKGCLPQHFLHPYVLLSTSQLTPSTMLSFLKTLEK